MKKNIYLNKQYLIKWTENNSAFLVQSPFNANAGIWWSKNWYFLSTNWPDKYFATGIIFEKYYEEVSYSEMGIVNLTKIKGKDLYYQFKNMIKEKEKQYLQMALATKNQLANLEQDKLIPLISHNIVNDNNIWQKLKW